jgi:hypothetical protein
MLQKLKHLAYYCDSGNLSALPEAGKFAAWRFYWRMRDFYYIETGRDVSLAYDLAQHGLIKNLGGEWGFEIVAAAWAVDQEQDFIERVCKAVVQWREARAEPQDKIEKQLTILLDHQKWPHGYEQAVLRNSLVSAWSGFEALATDLWAAALEGAPEPLLRNALISDDVQKDTFLQVRKALGTGIGEILARKMAMKTLPAIKNAYGNAFGTEEFPYLSEQHNPTLKELEKTRHLIVHRGSVVDQEFLKVSGVTAPVNQVLELSREHVHELVASAIDAGLKLIMHTRDWFWSYLNDANAHQQNS